MTAFDGRALLLLILLAVPAAWLILDWSRRNVDRNASRALNHPTLWSASYRAAQEAADRVPDDPERPARIATDRLGIDEYLPREDRS